MDNGVTENDTMEAAIQACDKIPTNALQLSAREIIKIYFIRSEEPGISQKTGYLRNWKGFLEASGKSNEEIKSMSNKGPDEILDLMMSAFVWLREFLECLLQLDLINILTDNEVFEGFLTVLHKDIDLYKKDEPKKQIANAWGDVGYHAFLAYAEHDLRYKPYVRHLRGELENNGIRLFVRDRDMLPGTATFPALVGVMKDESCKILLLLTAISKNVRCVNINYDMHIA